MTAFGGAKRPSIQGMRDRHFRQEIRSNLMVAIANWVVHSGGHKTEAGPLTKPYFIGFLGFPEPAAGNPFLSAIFF
jgi:hypothetical protein